METVAIKQLRENNFDFLRIILASFVVFTHSYPLSGLDEKQEWLSVHTCGLTSFSNLGVGGFFAISGYLVYQSFLRTKGYKEFLYKRMLRIYPGLTVNLLIAAIVVGGIIYGNFNYYKHTDVYWYIINNIIMINTQYGIAGVFVNNPYKNVINGSLWTIQYEILFYIMFFVIFINAKILNKLVWIIPVLLILMILFVNRFPQMGYGIFFTSLRIIHIAKLGIWFLCGIWLAAFKNLWIQKSKLILFLAILMAVFLYCTWLPFQFLPVVWSVIVIVFGSFRTKYLSGIHKFGDPSYGMYIYGFLIQQIIIYYFNLTFTQYFVCSLASSILIGYVSWHLIEKKGLRLKYRTNKLSDPKSFK